MSRILVSGASGIVGYGILRNLRYGDNFLVGTTIYDESPANGFSDIVLHPPKTVDVGYIDWLLDTIRKYKIDMIIPGIEIDMDIWNRKREDLESTGVQVLLNRASLIELCLDKWKFYNVLNSNFPEVAIPTEIDVDLAMNLKGPLLLKPRCGFGSKGIHVLASRDELLVYQDSVGDDLMVQEIVGDDNHEYTVSVFFDVNSEIKATIALKRTLSKDGYTDKAQVIDPTEFIEVISRLAGIFKPIGPTNFQFRKTNRGIKLLEINPRISSSTSIKAKFGYNEEKMCLDYFLKNQEIRQPIIRRGHAIRYIEEYVEYKE